MAEGPGAQFRQSRHRSLVVYHNVAGCGPFLQRGGTVNHGALQVADRHAGFDGDLARAHAAPDAQRRA
jgi:hypothetical protein